MSNTSRTALIARQSIYNPELKVVAYELLFRPDETNESKITNQSVDGDAATSTVIINTFSDIGLETVIGSQVAFINFTRNLLLDEIHNILPPSKVVIEILEDMVIDAQLIQTVKELKKAGYIIALDDFIMAEELKDLVELADIIKLDVLNCSVDDIKQKANELSSYDVELLAEKIETHEIFQACKDLGFKYFQGYFLSKPNIIKGRKIQANKLVTLQLLSELQKPDVDVADLEQTLGKDAQLSYKLLKLINSAYYASTVKIESLREGIIRLGIDNIRNWASLIILTTSADKPDDLMYTTMFRAKMCELLAEKSDTMNPYTYFTVGLFSTLDAMLDQPIGDILEDLPLNDAIKSALENFEGKYGKMLTNVIHYEQGRYDEVDFSEIDEDEFCNAYWVSVDWTQNTFGSLLNS